MSALEEARRAQFPSTGHWASDHDVYKLWKGIQTYEVPSPNSFKDRNIAFAMRVLSFEGMTYPFSEALTRLTL